MGPAWVVVMAKLTEEPCAAVTQAFQLFEVSSDPPPLLVTPLLLARTLKSLGTASHAIDACWQRLKMVS